MVFKLIVGAMKPFVKQGTMQNHSIKNKHAEAFYPEWWRRRWWWRWRQDDEGSVVCTSYFPFVPTAYSITNLFCGTSRFWRTRFEKKNAALANCQTLESILWSASQDYWTRKGHWCCCLQAFCTENASGYQPKPFSSRALTLQQGMSFKEPYWLRGDIVQLPAWVRGCLRAGKYPWPALLGPRWKQFWF